MPGIIETMMLLGMTPMEAGCFGDPPAPHFSRKLFNPGATQMVPMTALKRMKYPHGSSGREYAPGEGLQAQSDRDAKALYVSGRARYGATENKTDLPKEVVKVEEVAEQHAPLSGTYSRRDMQAESGQIGEEKSPPSSRRGRQRARPFSKPFEDDAG